MQIYLNLAGRDPAGGGLHAGRRGRRGGDGRPDQGGVPRARRPQRLDRRRRSRGLDGDRPRLHQGRGPLHPERARHDHRHGAPDTNGRPRGVLRSAVPVRRRHPGHAGRPFGLLRPARLRPRRAEPRGQHQHAGNVHRRWAGHRQGSGRRDPHDRHRADDRLPAWRARTAAQSGRGAPRRAEGRRTRAPWCRCSVSTTSTVSSSRRPRTMDGHQCVRRRMRRSSPRCSTRTRRPSPTVRCCSPPATTSARRRPTRACSRTGPRSMWRTRGVSMPRRTATTSSTTASTGCSQHQERANFPFLGANIVDETTGLNPDWVQGTEVFDYDGIPIGVIGIELSSTPELVAPEPPQGSSSSTRPRRSRSESEKLRKQGVKVQVVLIHQGAATGANADRQQAGGGVGRPDRRHRQRHPGHDGRRDHRRTHAPDRQLHGRRHRRRRRRQRRRQLLRPPDGREGPGRRVGGRGDAGRQEPRRRTSGPTSRRSSTTPTRRRPCCGTR